MKLIKEDILRLAEGESPKSINRDWDCAMVIEELSRMVLKSYELSNKFVDFLLRLDDEGKLK